MAWLAISGIDLSAVAAIGGSTKGDRRDIGDVGPANDGTTRVTRQARKRDLSLETIPLSGADAFALECLVVGEGHTWSFDTSFYSSKGLGLTPSDASPTDTKIQASVKKYGAGAAQTPGGESFTTIGAALGPTWTQAVWLRVDSGAWNHYVQRSDGAIWVNGVRNDSATTPLGLFGTEGFLTWSSGSVNYYDDWVIMPGLWPTTWPPLVFSLGAAFSLLPYLNCSGDLVREAAVRRMVGKCTVSKVLRANPTRVAGGAAKDVQVLQVDLTEA